ncbi:MAG: glycoside hydrolase [Clostridia bacterium]|nr:glycoside hydrolase [Clostridia bacterium]
MMKRHDILSHHVVMESKDSLHNYFGWPTVARLQDGRLACAASGFRLDHVCPFGKAVLSFSEDNGKTWSLPTPVIDTPLDDRDAGLLAFGKNSLMVTSFNNTVKFQRVWNGWRYDNLSKMEEGPEKNKYKLHSDYVAAYLDFLDAQGEPYQKKYLGATYRISRDGGISWGDVHISPVTSPHGPLCTREGKLLWVGRCFSDMVTPHEKEEIRCYEMDGEGKMTLLGVVPPAVSPKEKVLNCEPYAIELPDGKILVHIRLDGKGDTHCFTVYQSVSADGGRTFSTPKPVNEEFGGAPSHIILHSSGKLIAAVGRRKAPYGIRVLTSSDGGETWEESILTDDAGSADLGYPSTAELPDGTLYTVWYERQCVEKEGRIEVEPSIVKGVRWVL